MRIQRYSVPYAVVSGGSRAALGWQVAHLPLRNPWTGEDARLARSNWPRSLAVPDKKVRFDDFELDYGRFTLCRSGRTVKLEGLPLKLLMFMVEKRGQLVTREQIASELWSKDVFVDVEQGINTAIRKIRRALADDVDEPQYLKTVVGQRLPFRCAHAGRRWHGSRRRVSGFRRRTGTSHHGRGRH